jgi:hypothetical protein
MHSARARAMLWAEPFDAGRYSFLPFLFPSVFLLVFHPFFLRDPIISKLYKV